MPTPKFQNGDVVKDRTNGYTGMILATTLWLNGCHRYILQSYGTKPTGEPLERIESDEMQLELVEAGKFAGTVDHKTGGPRPHVTEQGQPVRSV